MSFLHHPEPSSSTQPRFTRATSHSHSHSNSFNPITHQPLSSTSSSNLAATLPRSSTIPSSYSLQPKMGENPAFLRRRVADEQRLNLTSTISSDFRVHQQAVWEKNTSEKQQHHQILNLAKAFEVQHQNSLEQRREKLAALLTKEDEFYRVELMKMQESSTDRAKRLIIEARRLKGEREFQRQQYAADAYERQWKESCDDLRTIDSSAFQQYCRGQVVQQMQERIDKKQISREEDKKWAELWEADRQKKIQNENERAAKRAAATAENVAALQQQLEEISIAKKIAQAADDKERAIFQHILDIDAAAAKQAAWEEIERKRALQKEIQVYNEELLEEKRRTYEAERAKEREILRVKMEEYARDTVRQMRDRKEQRRDMEEYREFLRKRKEEERRMEIEMERLIAEDLQRANGIRDAQWERERKAREKLMKEVYETRELQVQEKRKEKEKLNEWVAEEKKQAEEERHKAEVEREYEERMEQLSGLRRKQDLEAQMKINAYRLELENEAARIERESAQKAEAEYREKLVKFKKDTMEKSQQNYGLKSAVYLRKK